MSTVLRARAYRAAERRLQELHAAEANKLRREHPDPATAAKDLTIVVRKALREKYREEFANLYEAELRKSGLIGRKLSRADSS